MVMLDSTLPDLTVVIHDVEGGVASMNHQIIENAGFDKYFNLHLILWRSSEESGKNFREHFGNAQHIEYFSFSKFDNYYRTLKKFNQLLNRWPGILVTNDGIELEAIRKFGTGSVVFSIVHDFYNLKLAIENLDLVDYFICHTGVFTKALMSCTSLSGRVKFLLHGVKVIEPVKTQPDPPQKLKIVSIGRLTAAKGVLLLSEIDRLLAQQHTQVEWMIIGSGDLDGELKQQWENRRNVNFYAPDTLEEIFTIARTGDVFISASNFEGYGIALLEAMSCGLVPIIHQLPVGVYSDLPEDVGFSMVIGDIEAFADRIARLDKDRNLLARMAKNANRLVADKYDISKTADQYLQCFRTHSLALIDRKLQPSQTLRLGIADKAFVPNYFTRIVKKFKEICTPN
jgi:glycosyltransferase involved in cell wall biosynthesis